MQFEIIEEMSDTIFDLRVIGKKYLLPFQKGEKNNREEIERRKELEIKEYNILYNNILICEFFY